jgi:hypothetical protein
MEGVLTQTGAHSSLLHTLSTYMEDGRTSWMLFCKKPIRFYSTDDEDEKQSK